MDPPPPVEAAGSSLLYSRQFYDAAKRRLRPGGIVQQWLPGGEPVVIASVTRALTASFPYVRVFNSFRGWGFHFLASMRPIPATPAPELARRITPRAVADLLERQSRETPERLFQLVLDRESNLADMIGFVPTARALDDDRPINEYFLARQMLNAARRPPKG